MPLAADITLKAILACDAKCPKCGHVTTISNRKRIGWINCCGCHTSIKVPDFTNIAALSASVSKKVKEDKKD
jgi:hypothetical protein